MPHPGRNNIYEATIKRMVNEALEAHEKEFVANRSADSDEQLLGYLCFCTQLLGHTPWPPGNRRRQSDRGSIWILADGNRKSKLAVANNA